jgi:branched-subunit amino acid ABC-type transport system permease component
MTEIILQGLLLGGLYALFALGQSLMFGVMRLTNTAQGDFIILRRIFFYQYGCGYRLIPRLGIVSTHTTSFFSGICLTTISCLTTP